MTNRDSGRRRFRPGAPRHAAGLPFASPLRNHAHRALRVFVAAGSCAAGLCLLIGSIVLVAAAADNDRGQPARAAADQTRLATGPGRAGQLAAGRAAKAAARDRRRPGAYRVVTAFSGRGNQTTRPFRLRPHLRWELRWTYNCPAAAVGQLIVEAAGGTEAAGASIYQTGIGGTGSTWLNTGGPKHSLVVISTCSWTMKAVQAR